MTDDPGKLAEQGDIQAMLWCSRNLREPEDRSRWWFRAIEAAHAGSADFDYFARAYGKWERWLEEEVDPYQGEKALAPLRDHVRTWLLKRCGLSFAQIKSSLAPDQWEDRDYGALPKKSFFIGRRGRKTSWSAHGIHYRQVLHFTERLAGGEHDGSRPTSDGA